MSDTYGKRLSDASGTGKSVINSAFALLDLVAEMQPARLSDLTAASGNPRPTVHRLLQQLIQVGAVRREGSRYALGANLLKLGATVTPASHVRIAARRPMAELAAVTGAAVSLSASLGTAPVFLEALDAYPPLRFAATVGGTVPTDTAQARAHAARLTTSPVIDAGQLEAGHSCVAAQIALGAAGFAVLSTIVAAPRPSVRFVRATCRAAELVTKMMNGSRNQTM